MGQCYKPINIENGQWLYSHDFGSGLKLMEHSWIGNQFVGAVMKLMIPGGQWHRKPIVWCGDYYDEEGIELAKEELRRHRILAEETSRDVAVESMPFWWVVAGSLDYYATYQDSLEVVEPDDINEFLETWIVDKPHAAFVLMPFDGGEIR